VVKLNFRIDEGLHERLSARADGAGMSLSAFVRSVLETAADPNGFYIFSAHDEILATAIQILTILAAATGRQSPEALEQGMADARDILRRRGLINPELDR
jgi:plasmid stability protein